MNGKEIKILFNKEKAYLTSDRVMSFEQIGIPGAIKEFVRSYWIVKVLDYTENEIFCQILTYHLGATEFDENQKSFADKLNKIQTVRFRNINTLGMLRAMPRTANGAIKPLTYKPQEVLYDSVEFVKESFKQNIRDTFFVSLKNVQFKQGGVSFNKKFYEHKGTLELTIPNPDIQEEFDSVKNYFANVLKTKKIKVTVNIEIIDHVVIFVEVKSPEIDRIDRNLIDSVKIEFVKSTTKKRVDINSDKNVYTMEEYLDTFSDNALTSNPFYDNDKELFEDLLSISKTKHYKHLRFLSSKHSHQIMKLRFVHKPLSFIFLIHGKENYHIVWETLDTEEATYVWHITKDINVVKMTLQNINDVIKLIKTEGKIAYINSSEDKFTRIFHDYSSTIDGFIKWKEELEDRLN